MAMSESESPRTVDGQILRTVREWETRKSQVALSDIVAVVGDEGVPREAVVGHVERLQREGELYAVTGGFRIP